jgi:hypothetical protein
MRKSIDAMTVYLAAPPGMPPDELLRHVLENVDATQDEITVGLMVLNTILLGKVGDATKMRDHEVLLDIAADPNYP